MKVQPNETEIQHMQNVAKAVQDLRDKGLSVGFSESCTGGLLSSHFTKFPGVSDVFMGSVVCYSNSLKEKLLGVSSSTLQSVGAVSSECAKQMAEGCVRNLGVKVAVSITGIAGPDGGSAAKPVGTVFIAVAGLKSEMGQMRVTEVFECHLPGDRHQVQLLAAAAATQYLREFIKKI